MTLCNLPWCKLMSEDWLKLNYEMTMESKLGPPQLIACRRLRLPLDTAGILMRASGPDGAPFIIIAPNSDILNERAISRLVALAMVDSKAKLLLPTLMPFRHAHAFVKTDGRILHQVIRSLPEWSLKECERITNLLIGEYKQFVNDFIRALLGDSDDAFDPPPPNLPLISSMGEMFAFKPPPIEVDLSGFNHQYGGVDRDKLLRLEYARDRYMGHLPRERVLERANDIMRNVHQIDKIGRITFDNTNPRSYYWMDRFSEILHESFLRNIPKDVFGHAAAKDYPYPRDGLRPKQIAQSIALVKVPESDYLVKYGKFEHILDAYETGKIRLGPAASYADPSLNLARKDDELATHIDIDTSVFRVLNHNAHKVGPRVQIKGSLNSNYYIFCMSSCLRARLFLDFDYEACLIIKNPNEFKNRLFHVMSRTFPRFSLKAKRVKYYDPLWVAPTEVRPIFWKHFRYAYQEEVRFSAIPPEPVSALDPVFISLGSLKDIANIVDTRGK